MENDVKFKDCFENHDSTRTFLVWGQLKEANGKREERDASETMDI